MTGRVLSEEEIEERERWLDDEGIKTGWCDEDAYSMIATIRDLQTERDVYKQQMEYWRSSSDQFADTIRDRDKTNAKLQMRISFHSDLNGDLSELCKDLQQQNTLMLSALERILANEFSTWTLGGFIRDTIAQVKALTVSKQEESTEDGDAN